MYTRQYIKVSSKVFTIEKFEKTNLVVVIFEWHHEIKIDFSYGNTQMLLK